MNTPTILLILFLSALLEAGGDALVRLGLHSPAMFHRIGLFLAGAIVLFAYGFVVNSPPWDFGKLLGVYVVFFFIVAQLISYFVFHTVPNRSVLVGGLFLVVGGTIISLGS
jgi:drug/metabolite transporter superfamily protein YnfA